VAEPSQASAFTLIAPYYDTLMRGVPYAVWVRYIGEMLSRRGCRPRRVLDLACGTGNVSEHLAGIGYQVVGVDVSEPMILEARRKAARRHLPIRYYVQDAAELDLPEAPFDLCVCLFDSLNYIIQPARLAKVMRNVREHLAPGGLFIFDVNSLYALANGFFDQENLDSRDALRYVWRSEYDPGTRLCTVNMRFLLREAFGEEREFRETHVQFAYTKRELHEMLEQACFDQIETFHAYTFQPVRPTTDRIFFCASRSLK